jgi:hypothetical protein
MSDFGVRRAKAALSSGCEPHPVTAPTGSNRSSHGGNEVAEGRYVPDDWIEYCSHAADDFTERVLQFIGIDVIDRRK